MKKLLLFFLLNASLGFSQGLKPRKLEPISGHYKTFSKHNGKAKPDTTDRQHFPMEGQTQSQFKRLKIKSVYLNLPASVFEMPNFPENSSQQTQAELSFLHDLEKTRTPEKVEECKTFAGVYYNIATKPGDADYEKMQRNLFHMGRQIEGFNAASLPITAVLMRKAWADATYYFWALKFRYNRTRPYMLDQTLKPVDTGTNFQAYPSGHASASYMAAFIYQELFPEHINLFTQNAFDMAFSREIIGVHFPSDSEAGRIFARQFVNLLFQNPAFLKDFEAAKEEVNLFRKSKRK
jgi:acid phosphatase (class A)